MFGTDILFLLLLALKLLKWKGEGGKKINGRLMLLVVCFVVVCALSVLVAASNPPVAYYRFIKLIEYVLLCYFVFEAIGRTIPLALLCWTLLASALLQSLIGVGQYALQHSLGLKLLGESFINLTTPRVAVFYSQGIKYLRAYGTTPHPNILSAWLMIGLWSLWYLWNQYSRRPIKYLLLVSQALLATALVLTFSRTAYAIFALLFVINSIYILQNSNRRQLYRWLIIMSAVYFCLLGFVFQHQLLSRVEIDAKEEAVTNRLYFKSVAEGVIRHHQLIGIGIGQYIPKLMNDLGQADSYYYQPVHNIYLLISSETGSINLAIFILIVILIYRGIAKTFKENTGAGFLKINILSTLLFLGLFDHFLWSLNMGNLMLWLTLGIALGA